MLCYELRVTCLTQVQVGAPAAGRAIRLSAPSGDCASNPSKPEPSGGFVRKGTNTRCSLDYQVGVKRRIL